MKKLFGFENKEKRFTKFRRINRAFGAHSTADLVFKNHLFIQISLSYFVLIIFLNLVLKANVEEDIDWWCKFYSSLGENKKSGSYAAKGYEKITVIHFHKNLWIQSIMINLNFILKRSTMTN